MQRIATSSSRGRREGGGGESTSKSLFPMRFIIPLLIAFPYKPLSYTSSLHVVSVGHMYSRMSLKCEFCTAERVNIDFYEMGTLWTDSYQIGTMCVNWVGNLYGLEWIHMAV